MRKELSRRYDRIASRYAKQIYENFWNNILEYPATVAEIRKLKLKGKKVLDVGCGSGRYTKILLSKGARVWGIDNSAKMLAIAKRDVTDATFSIGDGVKTRFKSNFFDVVFSGLVLEYLDRDKFFKEMVRILKTNGILLFSAHVPYLDLATRTAKGKQTFKFKNYFREGKFYGRWPSFRTKMPFMHATMQTVMRAILKNGFVIEDYVDIEPPAWSRAKFQKDYERVTCLPPFYIMKVKKIA